MSNVKQGKTKKVLTEKQKKATSQTSLKKLTLQMIEAAKAVGDVSDRRWDYEIAAEIPISSRQLINWKKIPEFMAIVNKSLDESKTRLRLAAYKSLTRQVIAGNVTAVKEALDRTEGTVKQKTEHSGEEKHIINIVRFGDLKKE